ncbi:MAG: hypothetical protein BGN86_04955 [Caulobacterales bacterium 68-7]|nr:PepSY domain-containing protein [Caulobacterales bacterium]OJU09082.1 MAG: hypothetical protein BGN86_04955 [Caulobacterales bacterium 68-7]
MFRSLTIAVALGLASLASPAAADGRADQQAARRALERKEILPLPRILTTVSQRVPGDILKVELERRGERFVYEVRVLGRDGRVIEVDVDARSGAVLREDDD